MNFLTKLFLVLLVVTSLLTASAAVVYVNKEAFTDISRKQMETDLAQARTEAAHANEEASSAKSQLATQIQTSGAYGDNLKRSLDKATADNATSEAKNQQLQLTLQTDQANLTSISTQLAVALSAAKDAADRNNTLRDALDKAQKDNAETETALADQRQRADTLGRQVEYLTEQVKKQSDRLAADEAALKNANVSLPQQASAGMGGPSSDSNMPPVAANPVNGSVLRREVINGVLYLTISVGTNDNVQNGMEFQVVDTKSKPQKFLGILTVTKAETSSAIGRLEADNSMMAQVQEGDLVTTHLQ